MTHTSTHHPAQPATHHCGSTHTKHRHHTCVSLYKLTNACRSDEGTIECTHSAIANIITQVHSIIIIIIIGGGIASTPRTISTGSTNETEEARRGDVGRGVCVDNK